MARTLTYTQEKIMVPHPKQGKEEAYLLDKNLIEAVNLSILLGRPLLLKGEPGSGKTRLARAIAWMLYKDSFANKKEAAKKYEDFFFEWYVKSVSKAKEGLYHFDYIQQLRDTQKAAHDKLDTVKPDYDYVKFRVLGTAFQVGQRGNAEQRSNEKDIRPVILIDEIDKADVDFPNDLLLELDQMQIVIEELPEDHPKRVITANRENQPIVIVTSNDEKELPPAFLRRCVFYHIGFPYKNLEKIVEGHFPKIDEGLRKKRLRGLSEITGKNG